MVMVMDKKIWKMIMVDGDTKDGYCIYQIQYFKIYL